MGNLKLRIIMMMMIGLSVSAGVFAQNNWEKLKSIPENSALIVEKKDGKTIKGYLVSMND